MSVTYNRFNQIKNHKKPLSIEQKQKLEELDVLISLFKEKSKTSNSIKEMLIELEDCI